MRPLNENYVYDLSELTSEEFTKLTNHLKNNYDNWKNFVKIYDGYTLYFNKEDKTWYQGDKKPTHNAKELFYTLENIQVDCSELSEGKIEEMTDVFEKNGFKLSLDGTTDEHFYLRLAKCGKSVNLYRLDDTKTTITYEKFIELFGEQKGTESGWYKHKDGSLLYVTSECKSGHLYGYGFDKDSWVYNVDENGSGCVFNTVAKNYKIPATKEEVEKRLVEHAITEHKYNDGVFEFKGNVLYYNNTEIMKGGIWTGCFVNKYATETFNPQPHYDNTNGSLYKVATERKWNAYIFDVVKRLERGGKKDPLEQEIQKSIDVLILWKKEIDAKKN